MCPGYAHCSPLIGSSYASKQRDGRGPSNTDISICLDQVEHAGTFLELERLIPSGQQTADAQAALDAFVRSFPVALQRTTSTYDSLIRTALAPS
jgi:adenylate cyclase class 2